MTAPPKESEYPASRSRFGNGTEARSNDLASFCVPLALAPKATPCLLFLDNPRLATTG
jgi:hypothetical protein